MKRWTFLLVVALLLPSCSWIDRGAEHVGQLIDTRQEKQQRGWEWEDYLTCDMSPELHIEGDGERWCTRLLAPTVQDCLEGNGMRFWFGDSLSGISRQVLYDICRQSNVGEQWPHLDGLYQNGKLVVRDANRGSKPL